MKNTFCLIAALLLSGGNLCGDVLAQANNIASVKKQKPDAQWIAAAKKDISLLGSSDFKSRAHAHKRLYERGVHAVPLLRARLKDTTEPLALENKRRIEDLLDSIVAVIWDPVFDDGGHYQAGQWLSVNARGLPAMAKFVSRGRDAIAIESLQDDLALLMTEAYQCFESSKASKVMDNLSRQQQILRDIHLLDVLTVKPSADATDTVESIAESLKSLSDFNFVSKLELYQVPLGPEGTRYLVNFDRLVSLDLHMTGVSDAGMIHLGKLKELERLNLQRVTLNGDSLKHLRNCPKLSQLDLSHASVSDVALASLGDCKNLKSIVLSGKSTTFTGRGLEALSSCSALKTIDLSFSEVDVARIAALAKLPALEEVSFRYAIQKGGGALDLRGIEKCSRLKNVDLYWCLLTDDEIAPIAAMDKLESLNLSCNSKITDTTLKLLSKCGNLKALMLEQSEVSDKGLAAIANLKLEELSLSYNRGDEISDVGMKTLSKMKTLKSLYLRNNGRIRKEGFKALLDLPNLEYLSLGGTLIDDEGFKALAALQKLRTLEIFDCRNVTAETAKAFQAARLDCTVHSSHYLGQ